MNLRSLSDEKIIQSLVLMPLHFSFSFSILNLYTCNIRISAWLWKNVIFSKISIWTRKISIKMLNCFFWLFKIYSYCFIFTLNHNCAFEFTTEQAASTIICMQGLGISRWLYKMFKLLLIMFIQMYPLILLFWVCCVLSETTKTLAQYSDYVTWWWWWWWWLVHYYTLFIVFNLWIFRRARFILCRLRVHPIEQWWIEVNFWNQKTNNRIEPKNQNQNQKRN